MPTPSQHAMRYAISDETWAVLDPLVERWMSSHGPAPVHSDRMSFEGVHDRVRVGCPWRDLPAEFGDWSAGDQDDLVPAAPITARPRRSAEPPAPQRSGRGRAGTD